MLTPRSRCSTKYIRRYHGACRVLDRSLEINREAKVCRHHTSWLAPNVGRQQTRSGGGRPMPPRMQTLLLQRTRRERLDGSSESARTWLGLMKRSGFLMQCTVLYRRHVPYRSKACLLSRTYGTTDSSWQSYQLWPYCQATRHA